MKLKWRVDATREENPPYWHADQHEKTWWQVVISVNGHHVWTFCQVAHTQEEAEAIGAVALASKFYNLFEGS